MQTLGALPDFEFISTMPAVTCIDKVVLMPWTMIRARARAQSDKGAEGQEAMKAGGMGQGAMRADAIG